ncbi:MAG: carboxylating nicotinate-nucleotide diphosphorylase [Salinivirgaceae bacterium]|nr:carboxylating nicotinate-nucleotide diphosphorylase [Salinivirgaceae bacterium]MDD4747352.1 carboxylating nicotinate-nucleotide diphosphorylase [Salinivirgaceae bacterium]MDY0281912.1 carboxylating nicotinate-nucleotide diphosphorylase [Salinivirgaceae bacterium]
MDKTLRRQAILLALKEDSEQGDHTSLACIPSNAINKATLKVKESGVISGINVAKDVISLVDPKIEFHKYMNDGDLISYGDTAFTMEGNTQAILKTERILLNLMQRMSGIATMTSKYVEQIKGTKAKILDTRKTAPCLRVFDKEAVVHGGGVNHRFGLFDMIMLKDNHIDYAGGIELAISKTIDYLVKLNKKLPIEIEVRSLDDLNQVLSIGQIDRIMLDNFDISTTIEAVKIVNGRYPLESSGGITISSIRDYALCGVDYISVGALTHNVKGLDLSLKAC